MLCGYDYGHMIPRVANAHFYQHDETHGTGWSDACKQWHAVNLIAYHQCDIILGDFNIDPCSFCLPPGYQAFGPWDGIIFNTAKVSLRTCDIFPAYRMWLSDHDWYVFTLDLVA